METPSIPDLDLIRSIGHGGFGEVWLAVNRATGRLRAVKLIPLHAGGRADPAGRELLSLTYLEARAGMQHPNLLGIHHVGKTDRHLFYLMDPADDLSGRAASADPEYRPASLAARLEAGPLEPGECLRCARQLLAGLAHLHAAGMVHRDVKPGNCLFLGGQLKLADFGLLTPANPLASRVGTTAYMPPDCQMDARADVYAAGLMIYEMMTGLPPGFFPSLGGQARAISENGDLRRLNRLVLRACQRDPNARFQDAREMVAALDANPDTTTRAARRRTVAIAAAALLLVTILAVRGILHFWPSSLPPVEVNFITEPFEATIYMDGRPLLGPDGRPYATPCTVTGLSARPHSVVLKHAGLPDRDIGNIDFSSVREVTVRWSTP
jgi:serine/threonine-protein kinase